MPSRDITFCMEESRCPVREKCRRAIEFADLPDDAEVSQSAFRHNHECGCEQFWPKQALCGREECADGVGECGQTYRAECEAEQWERANGDAIPLGA